MGGGYGRRTGMDPEGGDPPTSVLISILGLKFWSVYWV